MACERRMAYNSPIEKNWYQDIFVYTLSFSHAVMNARPPRHIQSRRRGTLSLGNIWHCMHFIQGRFSAVCVCSPPGLFDSTVASVKKKLGDLQKLLCDSKWGSALLLFNDFPACLRCSSWSSSSSSTQTQIVTFFHMLTIVKPGTQCCCSITKRNP